jgi:electron transfer flavoprotein alpha subunit
MFSIARSTALRASRTQLQSSTATTVPHISALARLLSSLAVLEQRDGKLNVSSLAAVTAAQKLGGSVTGIVAGSGIKAVAEEAAKVKGLEKIIFVENGAYDKVCILPGLLVGLLYFGSICDWHLLLGLDSRLPGVAISDRFRLQC